MNIYIKCNIDAYKTNCFPTNLQFVPRLGERVLVTEIFFEYFRKQRLPTFLTVDSIMHTDKGVIVEVHYSDEQFKNMRNQGINPYP